MHCYPFWVVSCQQSFTENIKVLNGGNCFFASKICTIKRLIAKQTKSGSFVSYYFVI